jgi:hypothetical protein
MMIWGFFGPMPKEPKPEPEKDDVIDHDLVARVRDFFNLGFDELEALGLAWENASPSEARELLKKGCSHKHAARILL